MVVRIRFNANEIPMSAQHCQSVTVSNQLKPALHRQFAVTAGKPGRQSEWLTYLRWEQVVIFTASYGHGTVELVVVDQTQTQGLRMGPANHFTPLHVNRIVGVIQTVDVLYAWNAGQDERVWVVPIE